MLVTAELINLPNEYRVRPRAAPPDNRFFRRLPRRLAVISSYFNPCGYTSLTDNYHRFAHEMHENGVPLYTAELAFGDQPFALDGQPNVTRFRARDVMWHKERLLRWRWGQSLDLSAYPPHRAKTEGRTSPLFRPPCRPPKMPVAYQIPLPPRLMS